MNICHKISMALIFTTHISAGMYHVLTHAVHVILASTDQLTKYEKYIHCENFNIYSHKKLKSDMYCILHFQQLFEFALCLLRVYHNNNQVGANDSINVNDLQSCDGGTLAPPVTEQLTPAHPCRRNWISTVFPVTFGVFPVKQSSTATNKSHRKIRSHHQNAKPPKVVE